MPVTQFDNVRIATTAETERLGYAGKPDVCYGFTTPSVTGVTVVGAGPDDYALNIHFDGESLEEGWFASELVEFVDHAPGTAITVGARSLVRRADGRWDEVPPR